jgi:hypothetical protein
MSSCVACGAFTERAVFTVEHGPMCPRCSRYVSTGRVARTVAPSADAFLDDDYALVQRVIAAYAPRSA